MFNVVSIDVSRGKSTVSALQPGGTVARKLFDAMHSSRSLNDLLRSTPHPDEQIRMVMEYIGHYHEPIFRVLHDIGIFVSVVNPRLIKNPGNNSVRRVKSDPVDSRKIARCTLDNWASLR